MKTLIVIPAYNEAESLPGVIADVRAHTEDDILVISDGSTDGTATIARDLGVQVIDLLSNRGIGAVVQIGFHYAVEHGYDVVVRLDGDGQHKSGEIERLMKPIIRGDADIVIGSRFRGRRNYSVPLIRRLGIYFLSLLLWMIIRVRITDPTSGFCAMNRKSLDLFSRLYPWDYPEVPVFILAHRAKLKFGEVAVMMQQRTGGKSSITPLRSIWYMIKISFASYFLGRFFCE